MVQRLSGSVDRFEDVGDSVLETGQVFVTAADSKYSDDRISITKMRYGGPGVSGKVYDSNMIVNVNGKNLGSSVQKYPQGKAQREFSNMPRGEQDKRSGTRNGLQNGGSINNGGENGRNSDGESEAVSQNDLNAGSSRENSENQGCSTDQHDLIESIHMLQSAAEAIEKEVQRFRDIGTEDILSDDLSQDSCLPSELTSGSLEVDGSGGHCSPHLLNTLDSEVTSLKENVHLMEIKLEDATAMLKMKEAKIGELAGRLGSCTDKKEMGNVHGVNHLDLESELETLFKQKMEADIEYLTISIRIQDLRDVSVNQISQLKEKIVSEQSEIMNKLTDAESKAMNLKGDAIKLEKRCENVVIADETMKLRSSACKYTTCFLVQLLLLVAIVGVLISLLSPRSSEVVPT